MHHPKLWIAAFLPGILAVALALGGHAAHAAGVVTDCSSDAQLRTMLASFGEITFNCGGTNNPAVIVVSPTLTLAMGNTTLDGGGRVTLSGSDHHRLFVVSGDILYGTPFAFTLRHITLTNGYEAASVGGCMLIGFFATVTLDDVTVQNCRTDPGGQAGGIENSLGNLIVLNSRVLNNSADAAGGIRNGFGAITIANTLVAHNRAISGTGGGLGVPYGSAVISGSTFYSNSATVGGGGLSADAGTQVRIVGSRVENNRARYLAGQTFGGGIRSAGALTISTTTITGNLANVGQSSTWGGGLYHEGGALSLANVVVQANRSIHGAGVQVASGSATMARA